MKRFLSLLFLITVILASACSKEERKVSLSGTIYGQCDCIPDCPVASHNFEVFPGENKPGIGSFTTDASGRFSFSAELDNPEQDYVILSHLGAALERTEFKVPFDANDLTLLMNSKYQVPVFNIGQQSFSEEYVLFCYQYIPIDTSSSPKVVRGPFNYGYLFTVDYLIRGMDLIHASFTHLDFKVIDNFNTDVHEFSYPVQLTHPCSISQPAYVNIHE